MPYRWKYRAGRHMASRHKSRARRHASGVIGRAWRKRRAGRVMSNRKLTRKVKQLQKMNAIKQHYVIGTNLVTSNPTPQVISLTGIGQGENSDQHEGNAIILRSLTVHAQVSVDSTGGAPDVQGPTRYTMLIVSSVMDVGVADIPSFTTLYDQTNVPLSMSLTDGFRLLNNEQLDKVKILASRTFTLAPRTATLQFAYPSFKVFKINLSLNRAKIEYRENTSVALNRNYYIMFTTNSAGTSPDLGLTTNFTSKMTFRDVE